MTKTPSKKKAAAKKVPDNLPEDFYEVEAVIGHRRRYRGRVEYKIRWKGCSDKDDTWEPHENLSDSAMELAIQFTKRQKLKHQVEEDAKEVAGSPLTKQSLSASKSEQSPLIKRGGRTVFGSIRHPNRQVRFQSSQTKSFVSNAPNELHIEGKPDESPVSAHFFGTPTIVALPAVHDIMVMPLQAQVCLQPQSSVQIQCYGNLPLTLKMKKKTLRTGLVLNANSRVSAQQEGRAR